MGIPTYTDVEYAKYLYKKVKEYLLKESISISKLPKDFPIKKSTYYLLKGGYLALSIDKIKKVCSYIDTPAPKFVL